jgi:type VI secretion system secreted protein Hcp
MPSDIFAKLGDIKGESLDAKHKDEIEVLSYSWGVSNATNAVGPGGGAGAGKANFQDFSFMHPIDKATPFLLKACATGQHLKEGTITARKAGTAPLDYMIFKFYDILISGVSHSAASGSPDTGTEAVSLSFGKVEFEYRTQKADGSLQSIPPFKYDILQNKIG